MCARHVSEIRFHNITEEGSGDTSKNKVSITVDNVSKFNKII